MNNHHKLQHGDLKQTLSSCPETPALAPSNSHPKENERKRSRKGVNWGESTSLDDYFSSQQSPTLPSKPLNSPFCLLGNEQAQPDYIVETVIGEDYSSDSCGVCEVVVGWLSMVECAKCKRFCHLDCTNSQYHWTDDHKCKTCEQDVPPPSISSSLLPTKALERSSFSPTNHECFVSKLKEIKENEPNQDQWLWQYC